MRILVIAFSLNYFLLNKITIYFLLNSSIFFMLQNDNSSFGIKCYLKNFYLLVCFKKIANRKKYVTSTSEIMVRKISLTNRKLMYILWLKISTV